MYLQTKLSKINALIFTAFMSMNSFAGEKELPVQVEKIQDIEHYIHDGFNSYPKYSGALGFGYPSQTGKQAVQGVDGNIYYTFSRCIEVSGTAPYLIVSVADSIGNKTVLRRVQGYCDPHENAAVMVDSEGYITVAQSARGDWRKGYLFKSKRPYDISEFIQVASGYYAYPKPVNFGLIYTKYEGSTRTTRIRLNSGTDFQLVNAPGYSLAYQDSTGRVHVVYDYHVNRDLDRRVNIYYMYSDDGINWFNRYGESLNLPLSQNSDDTRITEDSKNTFIYIKNIEEVNGKIKILAVKSNSNLPDKGHRDLFVYDTDGSSKLITPVGHNYDGSAFWKGGIITSISNEFPYAGGSLHYFDLNGNSLGVYRGLGAANHPAVVGDKVFFGDTTSSRVNKGDAGLYVLTKTNY